RLGEQPVDPREERGQGLAGPRRGANQDVLAARDRRPALAPGGRPPPAGGAAPAAPRVAARPTPRRPGRSGDGWTTTPLDAAAPPMLNTDDAAVAAPRADGPAVGALRRALATASADRPTVQGAGARDPRCLPRRPAGGSPMRTLYVTTAIPYVNGPPHLGFAL